MSVADEVERLERRIEKLESENESLQSQLDAAEDNARDFEQSWHRALDQMEKFESDHAAELVKPSRPDVKRIDAGDWTRAGSSCVCDVCGYQFWEHPPVPGFMWMHRICDGRLVKL